MFRAYLQQAVAISAELRPFLLKKLTTSSYTIFYTKVPGVLKMLWMQSASILLKWPKGRDLSKA
jgi:hypothetical protein